MIMRRIQILGIIVVINVQWSDFVVANNAIEKIAQLDFKPPFNDGDLLDRKDQIGPDFYNWLVPNAYSSERSFFIQWKEELQYPTYLLDPQNLSDFPDGKLI